MRHIADVISQLVEADPSLEPHLSPIRDHAPYVAPEAMPSLWRELAQVLEKERPLGHEKAEQLMAIWAGNISSGKELRQ